MGLDVRWEADTGSALARFGGAAPGPQAEAAARVMTDAGLDVELVEQDDGLWDAQRDGQRARPGEPDTIVRVAALQTDLPALLAAASRHSALLVGRAGLGLSWLRLRGPRCGARGGGRPPPSRRRRGAGRTRRRARARGPVGPAGRGRTRAHAAREGGLRPERACAPRGCSCERLRRDAPAVARPDRRLRALRLLPPDLPDLPALGRGDGLPARADRADEAGPRRDLGPARATPGQLPWMHGLRDRLSLRRAVRQADRGHAGADRAQRDAAAR